MLKLRVVIAAIWNFLKHSEYLFPLLGLLGVVILTTIFDRVFIEERPGATADVVRRFKWANLKEDGAAATRELTARFLVEIASLVVTGAVIGMVAMCSIVICDSWKSLDSNHRRWLIGCTAISMAGIVVLWFFDYPFADTLAITLRRHAVALTGRDGLEIAFGVISAIVCILALPLFALTAGVIVATEAPDGDSAKKQLHELTKLLGIASALTVAYMLVLGGELLWTASLLPHETAATESQAALVRQLAVTMSLNYGVFFAAILVAIHWPSVCAVTKKCKPAQLGDSTLSPKQYYGQLFAMWSPVLAGIPLTKIAASLFS